MPGIPAGALHVVYRGHLNGGEQFAWGSWFDAGAGETLDEVVAQIETAKDAFDNTLKTQVLLQLDASSGYDTCAGYYYDGGNTAKYSNEITLSYVGDGAAGDMPIDCCSVVSLRTGRPGRSYRGRAYLPYTVGALTSHQFADTYCTGLATDFGDYLTAIKTATGSGGTRAANPAVMSRVVSALTPITFVSVDSRPDVQRRRTESATILHNEVQSV